MLLLRRFSLQVPIVASAAITCGGTSVSQQTRGSLSSSCVAFSICTSDGMPFLAAGGGGGWVSGAMKLAGEHSGCWLWLFLV